MALNGMASDTLNGMTSNMSHGIRHAQWHQTQFMALNDMASDTLNGTASDTSHGSRVARVELSLRPVQLEARFAQLVTSRAGFI